MFNYIKWELWAYKKRMMKLLIFIAAVYLATIILPDNSDSFIIGLVFFGFIVIMITSIFGAFIFGTKKVIDTFSKKTFLLESMVSISPRKLLLDKYVVAIIINLFFVVVAITGIGIAIYKDSGMEEVMNTINEIFTEVDVLTFIKIGSAMLLTTITYMSMVTFGYILVKVLFPSNKGNKIVGVIIWLIIFYSGAYFWDSLCTTKFVSTHPILSIDLICTGSTIILYYITSYLIENKLEVYN